ncbi:MAG: hypothetical protein ACFFCT_12040 [Candidatus Odinarchaeota archaeon]
MKKFIAWKRLETPDGMFRNFFTPVDGIDEIQALYDPSGCPVEIKLEFKTDPDHYKVIGVDLVQFLCELGLNPYKGRQVPSHMGDEDCEEDDDDFDPHNPY